jgi:hypothetical protein
MLPESLAIHYRHLNEAVGAVRAAVEADCLTLAQSQAALLPQQLQGLLATLSISERESLQPYNTEIHKEIRLLATDLAMWGASKQLQTRLLRQQQALDRCDRAITYAEALLHPDATPFGTSR